MVTKKNRTLGFTLVELMVVMAILGVLAAIVTPAVSGTKQVSKDSASKSDGTNIQTAMGKFNSAANEAELVTAGSATIAGTSASTSNRWAEKHANDTGVYTAEFPTAAGTASGTVASIVMKDGSTTLTDPATKFTAVDFTALITGGYLSEAPKGQGDTFDATRPYHNYLWLAKKIGTSENATDLSGRTVQVFKLTTVVPGGTGAGDAVTYQRIF